MIVKARKILLGSVPASASQAERGFTAKDVRIGFVNGMPGKSSRDAGGLFPCCQAKAVLIAADPRSPYPHLHAQAFLGSFDKNLPGSTLWRRNVVFSYLNWWALEDLRAEIREETSNNRVKSGYDDRDEAPIEKVPDAGAVAVSTSWLGCELADYKRGIADSRVSRMRSTQTRTLTARRRARTASVPRRHGRIRYRAWRLYAPSRLVKSAPRAPALPSVRRTTTAAASAPSTLRAPPRPLHEHYTRFLRLLHV